MKTEDRNIRGTDGSVALGGDRKSLTITVVGAGYVGLVTAACLAEWGHRVVCIDADTSKIAALKVGKIHFYEPDLSELVLSNVSAGRLTFDTAIERAVSQSEVVFLAVGTPARASDGHADMSQVYSAARDVARGLRDFTVIVTKSTVPVGTGDEIERIVSRARPDASFSVVSNPEFLREGTAVSDFLNPDRVVIGTSSQSAINLMTTVYDRLSQSRTRIVFAERRTAELIKYAANAFLATRISFINEIADLCERVGADVKDVALGMGLDSRIGNSFLAAGPGYGGSCFPKDTLALLRTAQEHGVPLRLVEETVTVNEARKRRMALKVADAVGGDVFGKTVAVLGLTFKANTDDMRDTPAIPLIESLQRAGAIVRAYDPKGMEKAAGMLADVEFCSDAYSCASGADVAVLVTDWPEFLTLDLTRVATVMRARNFVDLRNVCDHAALERHGFAVHVVGRPQRPTHHTNDLVTSLRGTPNAEIGMSRDNN